MSFVTVSQGINLEIFIVRTNNRYDINTVCLVFLIVMNILIVRHCHCLCHSVCLCLSFLES